MTFRELNISPNPTIAEIGILLEWLMKLPENLDGEKKEALHYESSGGKPNGMLRSFTLSPERMMRSRSAFQEVQNKLHGFLRSHASRSCLHFVENNPTYTEFLAQTPLAIAEDEPMLVWTVMCQEMTDELQKLEKQCAGNDQAIQHLKSLRDYFCDASRYPTLQEVWHMLLQERQVWPMLEAPEMAKGKTVMNDALARLAIDMMDQLRNLPEFPFTLTTQDGTQLSIFIPNKELETEIARNSIAAMPLALYAGSGQVTERYVPIAVQRVVGIGGFKSFTNQWQTFCDAVDSALVKQYPGRSQKWYSGVMQSNGLALGNKQVDMLKPYLEHAMPELGSLLCLNAMKEDGQSIQPAEELQKICVAFHIAYQPEWSVPQTAEDMNALMKLAHLYLYKPIYDCVRSHARNKLPVIEAWMIAQPQPDVASKASGFSEEDWSQLAQEVEQCEKIASVAGGVSNPRFGTSLATIKYLLDNRGLIKPAPAAEAAQAR